MGKHLQESDKAVANGVASLGADGKILDAQLPAKATTDMASEVATDETGVSVQDKLNSLDSDIANIDLSADAVATDETGVSVQDKLNSLDSDISTNASAIANIDLSADAVATDETGVSVQDKLDELESASGDKIEDTGGTTYVDTAVDGTPDRVHIHGHNTDAIGVLIDCADSASAGKSGIRIEGGGTSALGEQKSGDVKLIGGDGTIAGSGSSTVGGDAIVEGGAGKLKGGDAYLVGGGGSPSSGGDAIVNGGNGAGLVVLYLLMVVLVVLLMVV